MEVFACFRPGFFIYMKSILKPRRKRGQARVAHSSRADLKSNRAERAGVTEQAQLAHQMKSRE